MADEDSLSRDRIAFAAGLLAILFALSPAYSTLDQVRLPIFGDEVRLSYGYVGFALALGLAVYAYGLSFLANKSSKAFRSAGDLLYLVALVCPPAFAATFIVGVIQNILIPDPETARVFGKGMAFGVALAMFVALFFLRKSLVKKDAERRRKLLEKRESALLARSMELYKNSFYEHALIEATNAIVAAAERRMTFKDKSAKQPRIADVYAWLQTEAKLNIPNLGTALAQIRQARNDAAHGQATVTKEQCKELLDMAARIVDALAVIDHDSSSGKGPEA